MIFGIYYEVLNFQKFRMKTVSGQRVIGVFVIKKTTRNMNNKTITLVITHPLKKTHYVKIKTPTISCKKMTFTYVYLNLKLSATIKRIHERKYLC